jgi:hypothetical protein
MILNSVSKRKNHWKDIELDFLCQCGWAGKVKNPRKYCPRCGKNIQKNQAQRMCKNGHKWSGPTRSFCPQCNYSDVTYNRKRQQGFLSNPRVAIFSEEAPYDIRCGNFSGDVLIAETKIQLRKMERLV